MKRYKILSLAVLVVSFSVPVPAFFLVLPAQQSYPDGGYLKVNPPPQPFRLFTDQQEVTKVRAAPAGNAGDDNPFTFMFSEKNEPQQLKKLDGTPISLEEVAKLYGKEDGMKIMVDGEDVVNKYNLRPKGMDLSTGWPDVKIPAGILPIDPGSGRFIMQSPEFINMQSVGPGYKTPSKNSDVYVVGNYAYVTSESHGLDIIDISNPYAPKLVSSIKTGFGYTNGVYIKNSYAYVVGKKRGGMKIIDISNPSNPYIVGAINSPDRAYAVEVVGEYAYISGGSVGLVIVDISNPKNPQLAGVYNTSGYAVFTRVVGELAYVADEGGGLQIINIKNPKNPQLVGSLDVGIKYNALDVLGKYAYIGCDDGLEIVDISNPANPELVGSISTGSRGFEVEVFGNYAFLANYDEGLKVIDISDPTIPKLVNSYITAGKSLGLYMDGNYAYVANIDIGLLQIFQTEFNLKPIEGKITVDYNF
jgi:hypothetical protein